MLNNEEVNSFYRGKLQEHGSNAKGMGWKDQSAQVIRFQQLLKIISTEPFTINDLGCGTGDLIHLLEERYRGKFRYHGYDILEEMVAGARMAFSEDEKVRFTKFDSYSEIAPADYTLSSGIFNVKNSVSDEKWKTFMLETLHAMNNSSMKGFAFNALTTYSDKEFMKPDLYYSDPLFFFDYCKKNFSRNVALLHDYEIYDFTILVRK